MSTNPKAAVFDPHRPDAQTRLDQHIDLIDKQAKTILALQARLERLEAIDAARRIAAIERLTDDLDVAVRGPK